jgi:hypothetical protein
MRNGVVKQDGETEQIIGMYLSDMQNAYNELHEELTKDVYLTSFQLNQTEITPVKQLNFL